MMTVLSVLGWLLLGIVLLPFALLALIALLLCVPVWVCAEFDAETRLTVQYGFIPIRILPAKPKDPSEKKPRKFMQTYCIFIHLGV